MKPITPQGYCYICSAINISNVFKITFLKFNQNLKVHHDFNDNNNNNCNDNNDSNNYHHYDNELNNDSFAFHRFLFKDALPAIRHNTFTWKVCCGGSLLSKVQCFVLSGVDRSHKKSGGCGKECGDGAGRWSKRRAWLCRPFLSKEANIDMNLLLNRLPDSLLRSRGYVVMGAYPVKYIKTFWISSSWDKSSVRVRLATTCWQQFGCGILLCIFYPQLQNSTV